MPGFRDKQTDRDNGLIALHGDIDASIFERIKDSNLHFLVNSGQ